MLVTGASSGIGRAIAVAARRAGADVALTYRSNATARAKQSAIRALGRRQSRSRSIWPTRRRSPRSAHRHATLSAASTCGSTTPARTSSPAPCRVVRTYRSWTCCCGGSSRNDPGLMAGRQHSGGSTGGRRHHQHELGSRADRNGRASTRSCYAASKAACSRSASRWRDRWRRVCGSTCSRRMDRDLFGAALNDPIAGCGGRLDAARAMGHA